MFHSRRSATRWLGALVVCCALASGAALHADEPGQLIKTFDNPTPMIRDNFGFSVAASDDYVFIAAIGDGQAAEAGGTIYVFDAETYEPIRTINSPPPQYFDVIGTYMTTYEDYLLVGAWHELADNKDDAGAAYVFDPDTGATIHRFVSPTPAVDDRYGRWLVGVNGRVVVGAYKDDILNVEGGAAYSYDLESGDLFRTFLDPTPAFGDRFGYSLAAIGDEVLIAAYRDSELAANSGGVFVFDAVSGSYHRKILNPEPGAGDLFGRSMDVRGHYLAVGASGDDDPVSDTGSAYLIDYITGDVVATFRNPSPDTLDEFGAHVTFVGDNVLVGAWEDDTQGDRAGAAYLFDGVTGELLHTFHDPLGGDDTFFGFSMAAVGTDLLISAHGTQAPDVQTGAVYLFDGSAFLAAPGDATHDGVVDGNDYLRWSNHIAPFVPPAEFPGEAEKAGLQQLVRGPADGDFNYDGRADGLDYLIWVEQFTALSGNRIVPEPSAALLLGVGVFTGLATRRRRRCCF
ncbi:MAG: PEP-CTERM sorting domain-containing protein [Planctomycetales bacterium]|nr:PEP-CTERM sorting domain-containing protein [Planctomycetales bacterium]